MQPLPGAARLLDRREEECERDEAECQQRTIKKHVLVRQEARLRDQGLINLPQRALRGGRRGGPRCWIAFENCVMVLRKFGLAFVM